MFLNEKSPSYPPHISGIEVIERDSFHWGDCSVMVWGSNFKHSSVRLEETIYIKYLYYKKSIQGNINTWRQVQVWYHREHQLENAYSPFRCVSPFLYYQYLWVGESGKSPWYLRGWRLWILQNFEFPHPFPSNSKQCREFSPAQGQRSQFIPLYSPTYSRGWPGVLPQGQADDMCIKVNILLSL